MNIQKKIKKIQLFLGMSGVDTQITTQQYYDESKKRMRSFYGLFIDGRKIGYTSNQISLLETLVLMVNDIRRLSIGGGG